MFDSITSQQYTSQISTNLVNVYISKKKAINPVILLLSLRIFACINTVKSSSVNRNYNDQSEE